MATPLARLRALLREDDDHMPVFWPDAARAQLGADRFEAALADPLSVDLLTWNVFQALETHHDEEWLAYRLQMLGGTGINPPVRLQLFVGREQGLVLTPSRAYVERIAARAREVRATGELAAFKEPIEVAVRLESPDVLCLVETMLGAYERGRGGRDRIAEIIDAGWVHARRLSKQLAVAVVYQSGTRAAAEVSGRMAALRDRAKLRQELGYDPGEVVLREVPWQQLLRVWEAEVDHLELPVWPRAFLAHVHRHGLL